MRASSRHPFERARDRAGLFVRGVEFCPGDDRQTILLGTDAGLVVRLRPRSGKNYHEPASAGGDRFGHSSNYKETPQ